MSWKVALSLSPCLRHRLFYPELPCYIPCMACIQQYTLFYSAVSDLNLKCSHGCKLQKSKEIPFICHTFLGLSSSPLEPPIQRCVDCTLEEIECDFAKIECLVSSLPLSIRQCKINSLHGNLLWVVLLRQFAVFWGKGSSCYIYHPLPPATIQPTSSH